MQEYLNKYYKDIKDNLTAEEIEIIKDTVAYKMYLVKHEFKKFIKVLNMRIK